MHGTKTKHHRSYHTHQNDFTREEPIVSLAKCFAIVFTVSFVCFLNTLDADFVYDDTRCIMKNTDLRPTTPWSNIFFNDFWGTPLSHSGSHKSYRPLCILSFRVNYMYGELNPSSYHIVNNLMHCLVSCLFLYLCHLLYGSTELALFGGLLFAVHPIHTEAVAGVVGRADVGAALFFLISIILYHKAFHDFHNTSNTKFLYSILFACCSTFTKEQGITVLGVLVVYELLFISKCNLSRPWLTFKKLRDMGGHIRITVLILAAIGILCIRFLMMGNALPDFAPADNPAANEPIFLTRLLTFLYLPVCNICLLIFPSNLSYNYSMYTIPLVEEIARFENVLSIILYASLLSVAVLYLRYFRDIKNPEATLQNNLYQVNGRHQNGHFDKKKPVISNSPETKFTTDLLNDMILGLAMLILPFLPATNLFFYVGFIVAERVLYIPSVGFCLLVVNGVRALYKDYPEKRKQIQRVLLVLLVLFAAKTYDRNFVWKNEESLYRSGLRTSPAKSYSNLANILVRQGRDKEGELAYRQALKYRFNMADTHYNLGILLQNSKRYNEAIESYKDAIKYRPRLAAAHLNLGVTLMTLNKLEDALEVFHNASEISDHGLKDPHTHAVSLTHIRYNQGKVLHDMGKFEEALRVLLDALQRMPDDYERHSLYNMIGQCYNGLGNYDYASPWFHKALHEKPDHVPALLTVARQMVEHPMVKHQKECFNTSKDILAKNIQEPSNGQKISFWGRTKKFFTNLFPRSTGAKRRIERRARRNDKFEGIISDLEDGMKMVDELAVVGYCSYTRAQFRNKD